MALTASDLGYLTRPASSSVRPTESEYPRWLRSELGLRINWKDDPDRFDNAVKRLPGQLRQSPFWESFWPELLKVHTDLSDRSGFALLPGVDPPEPRILFKSWKSVLNKSWRVNVLNNSRFPKPPVYHGRRGEWVTPDNWLVKFNDIVRTTVVVRYLDGVDVVKALIEQAAESVGVSTPECTYEARDDGYYAMHGQVCVPLPFTLDGATFSSYAFSVEIQVRTQLHDVLRTLSHFYYEHSRNSRRVPAAEWAWDQECDQFVPNLLGHVLQYADGAILSVRKSITPN